jgi:hypothetical protein
MHEYTKQEQIEVLRSEIEIFKSRIDPSKSKIDIVYLADTISMLELRVKELETNETASTIPTPFFSKK